ncbi:MAG: U32 family peptidase [Bacteroidales bacterium]|nr:U32 family peptidase [Bacteroidales bacterium]
MKIITGISNAHSPNEIQAYVEAGVDEFFVGYIPKEWSDEYGWELSSNRRETASYQYREKEDMETVVDLIHQNGKKVYLTLNAHEYNIKQTKLLVKILQSVRDIEFDGFIISNLGLIIELQKQGFEQEINISIGGGSNNIETLNFFKSNFDNIGRFILPRKLTIEEIETIAAYARENNIRLEAFGMAAYCVFNDEYCFTWHGSTNKCFCQSPMYEFRETRPLLFTENWKQELGSQDVGAYYLRQAQLQAEISTMRAEYQKQHPKKQVSGHEMSILHVLASLNKCGLCAFQKFKDWGIEAVKLPLRGQNHKGNLAIVDLARRTINEKNATPQFCQNLMGSPNFCSGQSCYYNYPYPK